MRWYVDAGVDEAVEAFPISQFERASREETAAPAPRQARTLSAPVTAIRPSVQPSADEAVALAVRSASACATYEELASAVSVFEGCGLKAGARTTCFADGVPGASLLVIGEAPGRDEDAVGKPFVGRAGQLLDKMLAAIGRSRKTDVLISNVVYWRPPGNRTPTQEEIAICRPFVERLIELTAPKAVMLAGGAPTQALIGASGIMRARGRWKEMTLASGFKVPALPVFHPAFLLRQPAQKRLAWADLQKLAVRLRED